MPRCFSLIVCSLLFAGLGCERSRTARVTPEEPVQLVDGFDPIQDDAAKQTRWTMFQKRQDRFEELASADPFLGSDAPRHEFEQSDLTPFGERLDNSGIQTVSHIQPIPGGPSTPPIRTAVHTEDDFDPFFEPTVKPATVSRAVYHGNETGSPNDASFISTVRPRYAPPATITISDE